MRKKTRNIGVLSLPFRNPDIECGQHYLDNIVDSVGPAVESIVVMSGNYLRQFEAEKVQVVNVRAPVIRAKKEPAWSKAGRVLMAQFTLSAEVVRQRKRFDTLLLHMGVPYLLAPVIVSRLMGKKIVVVTTGSDSQSVKRMYEGLERQLYWRAIRALEIVVYLLSHDIVVLSESMISELGIESFRSKVVGGVGNSRFGGWSGYVETDLFKITCPWTTRSDVVGYVGRFSAEKGILQLVDAIPGIIREKPKVRFLIVGDGELMGEVRLRLERSGSLRSVDLAGFVSHDAVPELLNRMKFLVVPSYTEVFAGAAVEAMACGTICLTTKVGASVDIVVDGQTGFLLEDNDPATISARLLGVWNDPRLQAIQTQARTMVESNFTKAKQRDRWNLVIDRIDGRGVR